MRPKNSPARLYWVEALYERVTPDRPKGGKFTRLDSAKQRRDAILAAGGASELYVHTMDDWKRLEDDNAAV